MRTSFILSLFFFLSFLRGPARAQVGINTTTPSAAAVLDISSTNNNINFGGLLPPRVNLVQRNSIPVTTLDDGLIVFLSEGNNRCLQIYDGADGEWENIYCIQLNQPPSASNVSIDGDLYLGNTLNATFDYTDPEGDLPGAHTYNWYRADDTAGTNQLLLQGGTSSVYTPTTADIGLYMAVEVIPEAVSGASPGIAVRSGFDGPVTAVPVGGVIISEIADPDNDAGARFIELTNMSNVAVDISDWQLILYSNANTTPASTYTFATPTELASGASFVIGQNQAGFTAAYGFAPDGLNALFNSNGNDNYELRDAGGGVVDVYGSPGTDLLGSCGEFEDGRALRVGTVIQGQVPWDEAQWIVRADSDVLGCTDHANLPQNAPADFSPGSHPN